MASTVWSGHRNLVLKRLVHTVTVSLYTILCQAEMYHGLFTTLPQPPLLLKVEYSRI